MSVPVTHPDPIDRAQARLAELKAAACPAASTRQLAKAIKRYKKAIAELTTALEATPNAPFHGPNGPLTVTGIIARAAHEKNVSVEALTSPRRTRAVVLARRSAAADLRARGLTLKDIGRILGGRDHTTVIHILRSAAGVPPAGCVACIDCGQIADVSTTSRLDGNGYRGHDCGGSE